MTRVRYLDGAVPRVIAHRGGRGSGHVENTLGAFRAAWDLGVTHLETDVRTTADGVVVLWHDPDLRRLTGRRDRVAGRTLAELRALDLGREAPAGEGERADGDDRIATLAELLAALPEARVNVDVKDRRASAETARVILAADAVDRVLVASFSSTRRRRTTALLPGVATSADAARLALAVVAARLGLGSLVRRALRGVDAVQMPRSILGIRTVSPRMVARLADAVREVHVWTVDDPDEVIRLVGAGVHGIVTDHPDRALAVLDGRDWASPGKRGR